MKKILNHQVFKNMIALGLVQVANYILPLLAWPLLAKSLGLEQFGVVMMLLAICAMANILTDFGFNLSATHTIAQNHEDKQKIAQLLGNIFAIKGILAIIACIISTIYMTYQFMMVEKSMIDIWTILLVNLIIVAQSVSCVWFFHGIEKMYYITKVNIWTKLAYVLILFIVLQFYVHINVALLCFFISQLLLSILFIYYIYKEQYFIISPQFNMLWQELKYSFSFFVSRVAVSVYTLANTLILGHFNGATIAGLYGSAEKIYGAGVGVSGIVSQALFPYMVKTNRLDVLLKVAFALLVPYVIVCVGLSMWATKIIVLIFGQEFSEAGELLKLFFVLASITFLSVNVGYPGFSAVKRVEWANYTVMIGAIFHLSALFLLYLCDWISAKNVLCTVILTETLVLLLRLSMLFFFAKRVIKLKCKEVK